MINIKVFLGGTTPSKDPLYGFRGVLVPILEKYDIDYYNPVVQSWNQECIKEEDRQKEEECDVHLYCITHEQTGVYAIAEALDSAWRQDKRCLFILIEECFDKSRLKSMHATCELIALRGGEIVVVKNLKGLQKVLKGNLLKYIK